MVTKDNSRRLRQIVGLNAQYKRMIHALKIAEVEGENLEEKEYELVTFFLHCWHLKDHVKNDDTIPKEIRDKIVKLAQSDNNLKSCQELANGLKHFSLKKDPKMMGNTSVVIRVGSNIAYFPMVTYDDGLQINAIDLAKDSVKTWDNILMNVGIHPEQINKESA